MTVSDPHSICCGGYTTMYRTVLAVVLLCCTCVAQGKASRTETLLKLQVGEVKVLAVPDVARVAVGDGHVLNAVTTEEKEVIIFARNPGSSAFQVWSENGRRYAYRVEVAPEGTRRKIKELRAVLERIPNVKVSQVGEKLIVEGDDLSDDDRRRLQTLAKRYPAMVDFTGQVGWDRMVLLDVQVVEVPRSRLRELGVRWDAESQGGLSTGLAWETASSRLDMRPAENPLSLAFPATVAAGYFGINALLSSRIKAMAQTGEAVVLAQPQLLARSGATAEFLAGGEVPYSTVDANGNTNTAFKPYGVSLRITPRVERGGAVRSRIEVEVSSIDTALSIPTGPSLKTRRAATEFNVHSGQTLVLAGFLSREASRNVNGIPGLADIPVVGELFKSTRYQRQDTELAIFVTPVVVGPDHPDMRRRIDLSNRLISKAFPDASLINVPVRDFAPQGSTRSMSTAQASGWARAQGGSQWHDAALPMHNPAPPHIKPEK